MAKMRANLVQLQSSPLITGPQQGFSKARSNTSSLVLGFESLPGNVHFPIAMTSPYSQDVTTGDMMFWLVVLNHK